MLRARVPLFAVAAFLAMTPCARAQANLPVYTDGLAIGFEDWSWAPDNLANTSPVYSGSDSISVNAAYWEALWLYHANFNTAPYTSFNFWINGGSGGGQVIEVAGVQVQNDNGYPQASYTLPALATNTWQQFTIPLSSLGVANLTNCNGFWWQLTDSGTANTFYVDAVQLIAVSSVTHLAVNAAQPVRTADSRWYGINTADWDSYLDTPSTISELNEAGWQTLRFPGGSEADNFHWASSTDNGSSTPVQTSFAGFAQVATSAGAQAIITVNYGSGTPAEAAAWVKNSNVTNHFGFKYWEIGNENYGYWETDTNAQPNDPYTYGNHAQAYIQQMKAADPTIKIGVPVITGEDSYANGYTSHPATNPITHQVHYGWTPVLLTTLKNLGVTPDFAIYHQYPESGSDNDASLLQGTSNWTSDAANLRQMISNYFGAGGTNIELLCTENNSDSGPPGKQSVSLVNAIYYADSFGQLMQTEFNAFLWWDIRNAQETDGDLASSLYGWRIYGDFGVMNGLGTALTDRYPTFFSSKLLQHFVRGGDTVLSATSDNSLLATYAVRRTNGALTLLVINKGPSSSFTGQIALSSFTPSATGTIYSYGMTQDNAAKTGTGSCDIVQTNFSAATNFNYVFAPYSLTVFVFPPVAPSLGVLPVQPGSGKFVLQLGGQSGTPYILQTSTTLPPNWISVSTNVLGASPLLITNTLPTGPGRQFWQAMWQP